MSLESTRGGAVDAVLAWDAKLDQLDYYEILRVSARDAQGKAPTPEALRQAFQRFAGAFHPERYRAEGAAIHEAATRIFRRGNEALRVLSHPQLRQKYDLERRTGVLRLSVDEIARVSSSSRLPAVPSPASAPPAAKSGPPAAKSGPPLARAVAPSAGSSPPAPTSAPPAAGSYASLVTSAAAAPFAKEADRMQARGSEKQALLQLRIALSKEPNNRKLAQCVDALAALIAGAKR